ncbi:hypothetical protein ACKC9G_02220 [Pokkaliibacter sp. CJK22405]|uniref:hypothetical protein n=1 Tax=Pokkaliibacter sp. CJK22405 TaxID=3384615 RepID=UPI003984DB96
MKAILWFLPTALLLGSTASVQAETQNPLSGTPDHLSYALYGQGNVDCSEAFGSSGEKLSSQSWAQGYLSGNAFVRGISYAMSDKQHEGLLNQLASFCKKDGWLMDAMPALTKASKRYAVSPDEYASVFGVGAFTCERFLGHLEHSGSRTRAKQLYQTWLDGYLSAAALALDNWSISEIVQHQQSLSMMRAYCEYYPKATVVEGSVQLVQYFDRLQHSEQMQSAENTQLRQGMAP